jgi:hypothetical protein
MKLVPHDVHTNMHDDLHTKMCASCGASLVLFCMTSCMTSCAETVLWGWRGAMLAHDVTPGLKNRPRHPLLYYSETI